jgi:hypothetical protein
MCYLVREEGIRDWGFRKSSLDGYSDRGCPASFNIFNNKAVASVRVVGDWFLGSRVWVSDVCLGSRGVESGERLSGEKHWKGSACERERGLVLGYGS